jgi:hypothetical protein
MMGQHLENPYHSAFVPTACEHNTLLFSSELSIEHTANGVVHPVTKETITKYEKLANDPLLKDVLTKAMCKELGRLAQGFCDKAGTNTVFFMTKDEIRHLPRDRRVAYARIVVAQKDDPNRVRITVGGNLIDYPGELTTRTADLTTSKSSGIPQSAHLEPVMHAHSNVSPDSTRQIQIHESKGQLNPRRIHEPIPTVRQNPQWLRVHGNSLRCLQPPPNRHSSKQAPQEKVVKAWLLRIAIYPRIVCPRLKTSTIYTRS